MLRFFYILSTAKPTYNRPPHHVWRIQMSFASPIFFSPDNSAHTCPERPLTLKNVSEQMKASPSAPNQSKHGKVIPNFFIERFLRKSWFRLSAHVCPERSLNLKMVPEQIKASPYSPKQWKHGTIISNLFHRVFFRIKNCFLAPAQPARPPRPPSWRQ